MRHICQHAPADSGSLSCLQSVSDSCEAEGGGRGGSDQMDHTGSPSCDVEVREFANCRPGGKSCSLTAPPPPLGPGAQTPCLCISPPIPEQHLHRPQSLPRKKEREEEGRRDRQMEK